jgi:putative salt-induced outer membrane protein YdiY
MAVIFARHCFGANLGEPVSTNVLKSVKAVPVTPTKWDGTITLGLTATAGNVNSVLSSGKIAAENKTARNHLSLGADGVYGEANSVESAESLHGFAQYNHLFIDNTWYTYGRSDALHDAIADVSYRVISGGGAGYYFIHDKQTTLSAETGPTLEVEQLDDEYHNYRRQGWRKSLSAK